VENSFFNDSSYNALSRLDQLTAEGIPSFRNKPTTTLFESKRDSSPHQRSRRECLNFLSYEIGKEAAGQDYHTKFTLRRFGTRQSSSDGKSARSNFLTIPVRA
jgi:hypothetical protein